MVQTMSRSRQLREAILVFIWVNDGVRTTTTSFLSRRQLITVSLRNMIMGLGLRLRVKSRVRVSHIYYRVEEIVKFRRVVGSDWLEYIYNV